MKICQSRIIHYEMEVSDPNGHKGKMPFVIIVAEHPNKQDITVAINNVGRQQGMEIDATMVEAVMSMITELRELMAMKNPENPNRVAIVD